jgi:hypothetical protein
MGCSSSKGSEAETFSGLVASDKTAWDALMDFEWDLVDKGELSGGQGCLFEVDTARGPQIFAQSYSNMSADKSNTLDFGEVKTLLFHLNVRVSHQPVDAAGIL